MDYIAEPLRSLAVPIAELHEDPSNARKGHAVERIAASLKQYGQRKPIVVNRAQGGKVEAGNGTLAAAKSLGWTHIAAVFVEDDAATAAAYGVADNRVGEFSEWDADILGDLMPTLDGLFTGFTENELASVIGVLDFDPAEAWKGMPAYGNEPKALRTIHIHFVNDDDVSHFAELIDRDITEKTVSIWFPFPPDTERLSLLNES